MLIKIEICLQNNKTPHSINLLQSINYLCIVCSPTKHNENVFYNIDHDQRYPTQFEGSSCSNRHNQKSNIEPHKEYVIDTINIKHQPKRYVMTTVY